MHGLGNDFVIIDLITQGARLQSSHIRRIADRKFGIGCDQVILITPPPTEDLDFFYKIYNADGQEVEQCGNGARCATKFFYDNGLTNKTKLSAECLGGKVSAQIENNQVTVNLGKSYTAVSTHSLHIPELPKTIHVVSVGNPHGVCIVDNLANVPLSDWGKRLSKDSMFPDGANISFMHVLDRQHVNLRVYERGVGPTLACGSAACAAMLVGKSLNLLDNKVNVAFEYGALIIQYHADDQTISMLGPASSVFLGRFRI